MAIADATGLPVAACLASASPHEVRLAEAALDSLFINRLPEKLIGDKAYDSDQLDEKLLKKHGVELIAPHRHGRKKPKTQDGRNLRRYQRRWKVERLFAWLQNFRRLVVRYERHADNFLAFLQLACSVILLRFILR
jgi:transposase